MPGQPPTHEADVDPDSFGSVLRAIRKQRGESQGVFGAAIGLTQSQVSQLELSKTKTPNHLTLRRIAAHTGIAPGYLLELAKWPGAFRRGVPAELADVLNGLDDEQTEAVRIFAGIVAGDDPGNHGLSEADAQRIRNYAQELIDRNRNQ